MQHTVLLPRVGNREMEDGIVKRLKRRLVLAVLVGILTPFPHAKADDGWLNWYFFPFEYCANTCDTPLCCHTP